MRNSKHNPAAVRPANSPPKRRFAPYALLCCLLLTALLVACGGEGESDQVNELIANLTRDAAAEQGAAEPSPTAAAAESVVENIEEALPDDAAETIEEALPDDAAQGLEGVAEGLEGAVEGLEGALPEGTVEGLEGVPLPEGTLEIPADVTIAADGSLEVPAGFTPDAQLVETIAAATKIAEDLSLASAGSQQTIDASIMATEVAQQPILEELARVGVDPTQGRLAFTHPPISLEVTDFEDYAFENRNMLTVASDFVMAADVTWASRFAESGCGFAVRSDGDEEALNQYIIGMTRGAQGHVLFAEQVEGDVDLDQVTDIYANGIDPNFEWQSETTNRIVVVGRGQEFTIFSNGTRLGTIQGQSGFEEGFVAFIAVNRSGGIRCDYNNAYLWRIN